MSAIVTIEDLERIRGADMTVVAFPAFEQIRSLVARTNPAVARGAAQDRLFADLALAAGDPAATARACRRADLRRVEIELIAPASDETPAFVLDAVLDLLAHGGCIRDEAAALRDVPAYTTSLDAARAYVARVLPGFYLVSGSCGATGHASVGPDYDGPDGERLLREWPRDGVAEVGWHEELSHSDGPHREPRAILAAAVRALAHANERT
ncbi:hypothetical protein [Methylobacterium indicum]|uniref:Uncharacterized protein n=1 Tax=Methylobacterium indicum TaxID=1775910 RepID=A0A8H9C691_9HYPH|nr:hypothetical protein [Methylobacterium indicum]BCM83551.1 hypothetical protein mvi_20120 [Methylobacterium indicum]